MEPLESRVLADRYRLLDQIGAGGMGQVWRARDTVLERDVAVKLMELDSDHPDPNAQERFDREARTTAALNHPNIVTVHDSGVTDDLAYLVMELLPGPSLAEEMASGPMPVAEVESAAREIGAALQVAHARGLVHRDIKPGNVVRADDGRWRVVDFGISRLADGPTAKTQGGLTQTHMIIGTADYLSPEQALGKSVDGRSDLYALGILLWTPLAGHPPLSGATPVATMLRHANEAVPDIREARPDVPLPLATAIARLTAKEPGDRPQDAAAALALLDGKGAAPTELLHRAPEATQVLPGAGSSRAPVATPRPSVERQMSERAPMEPDPRERRWIGLVVGVVVALLVGALLWNWWSNRDEGGTAQPGPTASQEQSSAAPTPTQDAGSVGRRAVAGAVDALSSAVSGAERLGAIDEATAQPIKENLDAIGQAVEEQKSGAASQAMSDLRSAYDQAVSDGQIKGTTKSLLDPLVSTLEDAVTKWAD